MSFQVVVILLCHYYVYCLGQLCNEKDVTSFIFSPLQVKYTGCNDSTSTSIVTQSPLDCSRTCHNEENCVAFSYNKTSGLCSVCSDYSVKSLVVDTGPSETFYGLRQNIQYVELTSMLAITSSIVGNGCVESSSTFISKVLDLPCGIVAGNLIMLRGVYSGRFGFFLEIQQNNFTTLLHFRPRIDLNCTAINHMIEGQWSQQYSASVAPFTVGESFVVNILARGDSYAIFVNGGFLYNYTYVRPPAVARYLKLEGCVQNADLSV